MIAILTLLALPACTYLERRDTIALHSGDAVAANRAIQTADPWPRGVNDPNLTFDARRMTLAIERYYTPPETEESVEVESTTQ